ncbi:astacin-like metalloprotease toxin 2 [Wyeomyia smithii]|uniref:astacin-like metalloprotease toxin 2 n=1 Tax=Wyeomyia smithii TaxID=174621 RepID=UPI002467CAD0|nr:astacin-like metalloprotease toxin 2 [Wyeomyia smithii]
MRPLVAALIAFQFCAVNENESTGGTTGQFKSKKYGNVIRNFLPTEYRWPNATVYYHFEGSFSQEQKRAIKQAMNIISSVSCVQFLVKSENQSDYVEITSESSGCWSDTGHKSHKTQLNFGPECFSLGTILHELMHTLGFLHQHTRPDRDLYIDVLYENVLPRPEFLFNYEIIHPWNKFLFPLPYDFESIMHYTVDMYSRDPGRLPTMVPKSPLTTTVTLGQRNKLSEFDVLSINFLYCV